MTLILAGTSPAQAGAQASNGGYSRAGQAVASLRVWAPAFAGEARTLGEDAQ